MWLSGRERRFGVGRGDQLVRKHRRQRERPEPHTAFEQHFPTGQRPVTERVLVIHIGFFICPISVQINELVRIQQHMAEVDECRGPWIGRRRFDMARLALPKGNVDVSPCTRTTHASSEGASARGALTRGNTVVFSCLSRT